MLAPGDADRRLLERRGRPSVAAAAGPWSGAVVRKPWGHEFLCFQGAEAAGWMLFLAPGATTSLHCHPRKTTALLVAAGRVRCRTLGGSVDLDPTDGVVLAPGVFHAVEAVGASGAWVLEVETPVDKGDLVRAEDAYGRVGAGYAPRDAVVRDGLDRFSYFSLGGGQVAPATAPCGLTARAVVAGDTLALPPRASAAVAGGRLASADGRAWGPGDALHGRERLPLRAHTAGMLLVLEARA